MSNVHVPKTVKIGNEYYREGVKVAAPKPKAKKVIPKKPEGLAGSGIDLDKAMRDEKQRRGFFKNLAGQ